jgi:hypothetical protein
MDGDRYSNNRREQGHCRFDSASGTNSSYNRFQINGSETIHWHARARVVHPPITDSKA